MSEEEVKRLVRSFHTHIRILAGVNVLAATMVALVAFLSATDSSEFGGALLAFFLPIAGILVLFGVLVYYKYTWALVVSLAGYALFFVSSLLAVQWAGIAVFGASLVQGFRVLRLEKALAERGLKARLTDPNRPETYMLTDVFD